MLNFEFHLQRRIRTVTFCQPREISSLFRILYNSFSLSIRKENDTSRMRGISSINMHLLYRFANSHKSAVKSSTRENFPKQTDYDMLNEHLKHEAIKFVP